MHVTLFRSIIPLFMAGLLLAHDSVYARGPKGGIQTLSAPSFRGGRGGSIGTRGLSFGGSGISFGGSGIRFGTRKPTPRFEPNRSEIPGRNGYHGGMHVIPGIQIVPHMELPNPTPTPAPHWRPPQSHYHPQLDYHPQPDYQPEPRLVQPATHEVQPNELPANPAPEPAATDPEPNLGGVMGRQITEAEVQRAREFFRQRLLDLAKVLEQRLPPADYDPELVTALMIKHALPIEAQIQILDALQQGDHDTARQLWETLIPRVRIPFKPSRIRLLFLKFYVIIQRGYVSYPIVYELIQNLPPEALRPSTCCGADDLLAQIEEEVRINQAIGGVTPETTTDFGKPESFSQPRVNDKPYTYTSANLDTSQFHGKLNSFGKPSGFNQSESYGKPGQPVPVPSGPVNIVYHPTLPDRQVVVVNARTVMVGTGGRGVFRMEHGYVAEALGHRVGRGTPMPANQSDLIRSGVVVVNPTHAQVHFVFGPHEVTLEPGYQQVLKTEDVISFDRGGGKGTARYTLKPGTYEFEVSRDGWNLHSKNYEVTISNEGNLEPFNCIIQGEHVSLAPEETQTHNSEYPILIRFDRGDGSATKQVRWQKNQGVLQVAINPADNLWDLFLSSEEENREPEIQPTPEYVPAF